MRGLALLLVVAGCDLAFGLERPSCDPGVDEDGDGTPDECDTCPGVRDVTNRDGDGDGVGDACDPEPAVACQRRYVFDGFAEAIPQRLASDEWSFDGEDALHANVDGSLALVQYPAAAPTRVQAELAIEQFAAAPLRFVELGTALEVTGARTFTAGVTCRLIANADLFQVRIVEHVTDTTLANEPYTGDTTFDNVRLTFDTLVESLACDLAKPNGAGSATASAPMPLEVGAIAIRVQLAAVRVHWIDILERTCP